MTSPSNLGENSKNARLLLIGSELLNGYISDTNLAFFANSLYEMGYRIVETRVVGDSPEDILGALEEWAKTKDLIITTGGLGPTEDDLTIDLLCQWLDLETTSDPQLVENIRRKVFERYKNIKTYTDSIRDRVLRQARVPQGAQALENSAGLAPGIYVPQVPLIAFPGFPVEIEAIWPHAAKVIEGLGLQSYQSRVVPIWGIAESTLFGTIRPPKGVEMGVHALPWGSKLFFRAPLHKASPAALLDELLKDIHAQYGANIMEDPIERWAHFLKQNSAHFATAESCTGGLAAKLLTDLPGASQVFPGSVVAYANEAKETLLGVRPQTLQEYGAVSGETAAEMAQGALEKFNADYAISTTGIAGPSGGSAEKPMGTVYIGMAAKQGGVQTGRFLFPFGRSRFRDAVVYTAYLALCQKFYPNRNSFDWKTSALGKIFVDKKDTYL